MSKSLVVQVYLSKSLSILQIQFIIFFPKHQIRGLNTEILGANKNPLWFFQESRMDVSWTIKKAEHWRIDPFELQCWRRHLRVPWTARRSNQSILKEINPVYSLEGLMLKLKKLQYFGYLVWKANTVKRPWCWDRLKAKNKGAAKDKTDSITNSMDIYLSKLQEILKDRETYHSIVHGVTKSQTWLRDWTTNETM